VNLAGAALGDPDGVARRFDSVRCVESFHDHGNTRLVAIYGDDGNLAAGIFRDGQLAICGAHAEEKGSGTFGAGVNELLNGGGAGAHLVDERWFKSSRPHQPTGINNLEHAVETIMLHGSALGNISV